MTKKKQGTEGKKSQNQNVEEMRAEIKEQLISDTLQNNYMPYAMSVIVSRAIPEIDGFKPSHRKLLYTMYKMNLLTGNRTKSANIVGQTMRLNPHGDAAMYDTMVRLSKGCEALLMPFVDSKGNFGKVYSRDMACAASRYTEAKLSPICAEIFHDIGSDTVDFCDNYDSTMKEPTLLPTAFPNILVSANSGIAVGMASQICGFSLSEVCETAINLINDANHDIISTMPAPDFPTGGEIIYDINEMQSIYESGRGSFKVRSRWRYVSSENLIEVYEIPYTTTVESIMDKVSELVKSGKLRDIADMRDETDLGGLKLTIDLRRGTDPEKLMQKLFKLTTLQDSFSCNFNILIAGTPRVLGVREIFTEWLSWRMDCVKRRVFFELSRKKEKLHLLEGLNKMLMDIDKAISIIRKTELESEVVPNLMIGFGIDNLQAEYVAEIRLRNINREYILKRVGDIDTLTAEIEDMEAILLSPRRIKKIISDELRQIIKKYGAERKTGIIYADEISEFSEDEQVDDYLVTLFLSREGYFKKITPLSLRMSGEHKYKEGDGEFLSFETGNRGELLVFTDRQQVYKTRISDFEDTKASSLGTYLPSRLGMDDGESVIYILAPGDYSDDVLLFFENGKCTRLSLSAYATKSNRKKLTGAYSEKSSLCAVVQIAKDTELALYSSEGRVLIFGTALLSPKTSRTSIGVGVMSLRSKYRLERVELLEKTAIKNYPRYRVRSIPAAGALLREEDRGEEQLSLLPKD